MIAGIVGLLVLLLLFFGVRACNNSRHKDALREYYNRVTADRERVPADRREFFKQMDRASSPSATELYQSILGYKGSAEQSLKQAQALSVPGDMSAAQQSFLISLELRRDGLQAIVGQRSRTRSATKARMPIRRSRHRRPDAGVRRLRRPLQRARAAVHADGAA